ncbi:hypothetical protein [Paenibacillus sp. GP183]|uniref:hypothetical protein n=1 Tax=Paenibacillus sp. GP183 TaxID=1882751 RepID=UPI00344FB218
MLVLFILLIIVLTGNADTGQNDYQVSQSYSGRFSFREPSSTKNGSVRIHAKEPFSVFPDMSVLLFCASILTGVILEPNV